MRSVKAWWGSWKLARQARRIIDESTSDSLAQLRAESILRGLHSGRLCRNCLAPFDAEPRDFSDRLRLRSIMMIPDSEPDPVLCPTCFDISMYAFNAHATNIGTSNSGPTNLVLQKLS